MDKVLIVFMSATSANKVKSVLERKYAIPSKIMQTPSGVAAAGCSYCLSLNEKHLHIAWKIVKSMDLSSKGAYRQDNYQKIL